MVDPAQEIDLGNGSHILYIERFLDFDESQKWLKTLDEDIPWCRPKLFIFGRPCNQPRETCYVADSNLPRYRYSGFEPAVNSWDDYSFLKDIREHVYRAVPATCFNSVLLNRYTTGHDYAGWHADDERLYGPTPTIASVSLGAEREFLIRKKKSKVGTSRNQNANQQNSSVDDTAWLKDKHSFTLKNGSLIVMKGNMQRDWEHSIPRRVKQNGLRINLTFRLIL